MSDCIFCNVVRGEVEAWKVYESDSACAFLDANPVSDYHTLVVPKRHSTNIFDTTEADLLGVVSALKHVVDRYRERLGIQNLQVVSSSGAEAQQDVLHLHFHVIPRHAGDGQDVKWTQRPATRARLDELIARLGQVQSNEPSS